MNRYAAGFLLLLLVTAGRAGRADAPKEIWIEAEAAQEHTFNGGGNFPGVVSGDNILRLWKDPDPGPEGYWVRFPFTVESATKYHAWIAASMRGTSPYWWRLDEGQWQHVDPDTEAEVTGFFGVSQAMAWVRLSDKDLTPGTHTISVKVDERRAIMEHAYLLYVDALFITARDVVPDGLVRPTDLPNLKAPDRTPVEPAKRAGTPGSPMVLGSSVGTFRDSRTLSSLGFKLLQTDSDHLTVNETAPGKWDWAAADAGLAIAQKVGARWQYFPHFHWTTDWLMKTDRFVPSIGINTGRKLRAMSLWSPYLPALFDHGYAAMAEHYGSGTDKVAAIYLGVHGDFGEALFPLGYHPDEKVRFGEQGTGTGDYWCGDDHARANFREVLKRRYGTVEKLNAAWSCHYAVWEDVEYPKAPTKAPEDLTIPQRHQWLDFINWYHDSMTDFAAMVMRTARKHFPQSRLVVPVGNGDEGPMGGDDLSALVKACRESRVDMRSTHGGCLPVPENLATMLRRLASASHFYGVFFWSEPPGGITPEGEVGRFFESISCRANGYWDWGNNPVGAAKTFQRYKDFLTQEETVCDVALLYPTTDHRLRANEGYPPLLRRLGTDLRSVTDFDIVDELMVKDGALDRFRVLVCADGVFFEPETLAKIEAWVRAGGTLVRGDLPMTTVEADGAVWERLKGTAVGKGKVVVCAGAPANLRAYREAVRDVIYKMPPLNGAKATRELAPDAAWGSLYCTLLKSGEIIAFNNGDKPIKTNIGGHEVEVGPKTMVSVK